MAPTNRWRITSALTRFDSFQIKIQRILVPLHGYAHMLPCPFVRRNVWSLFSCLIFRLVIFFFFSFNLMYVTSTGQGHKLKCVCVMFSWWSFSNFSHIVIIFRSSLANLFVSTNTLTIFWLFDHVCMFLPINHIAPYRTILFFFRAVHSFVCRFFHLSNWNIYANAIH